MSSPDRGDLEGIDGPVGPDTTLVPSAYDDRDELVDMVPVAEESRAHWDARVWRDRPGDPPDLFSESCWW